MPRKGEYGRTQRTVRRPAAPARIGPRQVVGVDGHGERSTTTVDPARFTCSGLAAELADEFVELAATAEQSMGTARCYRRAVVEFCTFVDATTPTAADATLERAEPDLLHTILEWVRQLPSRYPAGSQEPALQAGRLRNLIARRAQHPDRTVTPQLNGWLTGALGLRHGATQEVDEYSRTDKRALLRAAWDDVRTVEQRLQQGAELLATGKDPRVGGWLVPANLLWAIDHQVVTTRELIAQLPPANDWPPALQELLPAGTLPGQRSRALLRLLVRMLYPHNLDLHAFRVLLIAATGHTSEEITGLTEDDVEFTPDGVELTFTKQRAHAIRRRNYSTNDSSDDNAVDGELSTVTHPSKPRLDPAGILRRLMAVTERLRRRSGLAPVPLFLRAVAHGHNMTIRPFIGDMHGAGFNTWLDHMGLELTGPADIRRLRKSGKVEKALAYRGRISDIADDHTAEVFRGHYAHGTTLRVLAGHVITSAQQRWFTEATTEATSGATAGPTVLTSDAETALTHPDAPTVIGLSAEQVEQLRAGALDMGVSSCRDPFDSPFGRAGQLCPVAPLRCLECRHALVLPSNLPQLLLLADHLDQLRRRLSPQHFHTLWGQSHANLTAVLADRTDAEITLARKHIGDGEAELHLPLSAHVEFDQ